MSLQIGDFIAIATLSARVFQALDSTRGSKLEFTSLLGTLKGIIHAMCQAEALCLGCHTSSFDDVSKDSRRLDLLQSVACDITAERQECEELLNQFLDNFAPYTEAFMESGKNKICQGFRKLTWMGRTGEIVTLEKRLNGHLQAMQLHLIAFCYATMKSDIADNGTILGSIDSSMDTLKTGFSDMQHKMSEALQKLDVARKSMPMAIGYCWGPEPPILLLDGLGRKTSLPMMFASSPDIFRDILLIMHRGAPGHDKIETGKYVISDEDSDGALVPRDKWHDSFKPGRRIALSFLLKHPGSSDEKQCPRCRSFKAWLDDQPGQRRCLKCHLTFKIEDRERTRQFWKDRRTHPKPPVRYSSPSVPQKPKETPINQPPNRSKTLRPDEYDHPYHRVHYQRDTLRRGSAEQPWQKADPEFEEFLAALPDFHRAAATGNFEKLVELLENGDQKDMTWKAPAQSLYRYDRTGWDFTGAPPIHFATYYGHKSAVLFLLQHGADIDATDAAGTTALQAAAWTGNEKIFDMLLKRGAKSSTLDYDGWNVPIYAMVQGHENISRLLLENSDVNEETLTKTYKLRHAAKLGNVDLVFGMLLEDQAAEGNGETKETLLAEALLGAAEGGQEELVQRLLDSGADAMAKDNSGSTALHWAVWGGHTEIGNLMYDTKGDNEDGQAEVTITKLKMPSPCHESVIQMLIEKGADINAQNAQGCTALHWVSGAGCAPMIQFLLDNGASQYVVDKFGRTAIDRAKETGDQGVIKQLQSS